MFLIIFCGYSINIDISIVHVRYKWKIVSTKESLWKIIHLNIVIKTPYLMGLSHPFQINLSIFTQY